MKNRVLKSGDLVKYLNPDQKLDELGFVLGQVYEVCKDGLGLYVRVSQDKAGLALVKVNGELTDHADSFAKHTCPVILPRGLK